MTHAPVSEARPRPAGAHGPRPPDLAHGGKVSNTVSGRTPACLERGEHGTEGSEGEGTLFDLGGRPLGPRAVQTRQRILDATVELIGEKPMRDLRVIDIARKVGSSPATFYQYFKDVEDVVLHLAREASERTPEMVELIHGDWRGREGHERARRLVDLVIDHWERYAPILRVRNNASDEGDARFREVRMQAMMPILRAFTEGIARSHERAAAEEGASGETTSDETWAGGRVQPTAGATALTSVLERLAMYHVAIEEIGGTREDLVETVATLMQSVLTSRR